MPCFGIAIVDPVVRMPAGSTVLVPQIRIQNPVANADLSNQSQVVVLGGYSEVGDPSSPTKKFLDIDDHSAKTAWIGHRQWRVPQTAIGSPLPTGLRLGDMVARPGGGLEAFSEREIPSASESWIPTTVNRYKDQATLDALDPGSINLGTLVWVDDISALRVCTKLDPLTWKTVAWT
jgi:hypothetical protein